MFKGIKSRNALVEIIRHRGEDLNPTRMTGTTTGLALRYLGEALLEPGLQIDVRDHYGTEESNKRLVRLMAEIADTLQLKGLIFDENNKTVIYHLDW